MENDMGRADAEVNRTITCLNPRQCVAADAGKAGADLVRRTIKLLQSLTPFPLFEGVARSGTSNRIRPIALVSGVFHSAPT